MSSKVLIVEDNELNGKLAKTLVLQQGHEALLARSGAEGLGLLGQAQAVLLDLGLPDLPGLEVLSRMKAQAPEIPVIVLTGDTEVPTAVKALQAGAFNYFTKPIHGDQVLAALKAALGQAALSSQVRSLQDQLASVAGLQRWMGPSRAVKELEAQVRQVAPTGLTVLIHGETGAGKEVVARALHEASPRAAQPFVALDCGAIPEALLESELFGHEKGAFTGADRRREGHFQLAQGGTLFLDEIANLPLGLQAKLLRVLQERELQPLGGARRQTLDIRVLAASNHDLEEEAKLGRFRQDLFYRLAEFRLHLPALRERPEDIPYLAQRFLEEAGIELKKPAAFEPGALAALKAHAWPGNVRELRNVVRQAQLSSGQTVSEKTILGLLTGSGNGKNRKSEVGSRNGTREHSDFRFRTSDLASGSSLKEISESASAQAERAAIQETLTATQGNILQAARVLQVDNKTLHARLKKYGIRARDFQPE
jgi:two-component system nitrogen regulation response regulator GlnG